MWEIALIVGAAICQTVVLSSPLTVRPTFLLVDEDWPLSRTLPVKICPANNVQIIVGDPTHFFSVVKLNETCSTLRLNKEFDADVEGADGLPGESFSLVLQGKRRARATLEIQVVDVNDNPPQFIGAPIAVNISEKAPPGFAVAKLRTKDVDTGISGMARFSVDNDLFSTDKARCLNKECSTTLRLLKPLDYESQQVHHVVITAEDGNPHSNRTLSAAHTITVYVTDENDEPPVFITDLSQVVKLSASQSIKDEILMLKAVDGDKSFANLTRIRYSVEDNEYVDVEKETGAVSLKKLLQPNSELRLPVTAKEDGPGGMETVGVLQIRAPLREEAAEQVTGELCDGHVYKAKIREGASDFEEPLVVNLSRATDLSMLHMDGGYSAFGIDSSASSNTRLKIVPVEVSLIDYEKRKSFELYVTGPTGRCQLNVDVLDVNDNSPKCDNDTFTFYVTENEEPKVLGEVKATDADSAPHSSVTYSIHGAAADLFATSSDGALRSLSPIDREQHDKFDLTVRATDTGGKWADCKGKVIVLDVNDNAPAFEQAEYVIEVEEEKTWKQKLEASDADLGENGRIVYSLENAPEGLAVEASTGVLFIGKLDRDTMASDSIALVLRATDRGHPPQTSATNVTILVKDINDNWPTFTNSRYSLILDANISPGGVIGAVKAHDADATSPNNFIRYVSEDKRFKVAESGEIIYDGEGVLSKDTSVEFRVIAVDGGEPARNSSAVVVINEHLSSMQNEHIAQIMLNETILRKEIVWSNSGMDGYTYEIVSAKSDGYADDEVMHWLEMDRSTGAIHTKKQPLPGKVRQIRLKISMKKGKREVPVDLVINVVDTSGSVPVFEKKSFKAVVSEDFRIGSRLLQAKANGEGSLKYFLEILAGPTDVLEIDGDGFIKNKLKLDFEMYRRIDGRVVVRDGNMHEATANFSIILSDANDNRPVFVNGSVFTTTIDESAAVGTILELPYPLARDGDEGEFSRLLYELVGDDGHFRIDRKTSKISLTLELDYETQRSHSITVRCVDNAGEEPFNEVFASVTVFVRDVNDNKPQIHNSDLDRLSVSEDAPIATTITVLSVSDLDQGGKQSVILNANHTLFRVTEEKRLVIAEKLVGLAGKRLCSNIVATDTGSPPLSVSYPYCVTVFPASDVNHRPLIVFPKPNSIHYFDENSLYEELFQIKLLEEERMDDVTYKFDETFKKDWEQFTLNTTGSLTAITPFDFERKPVYELKILACRRTNCSSVHVYISVNDRNDNCPFFSQKDIDLSLFENDRSKLPRQVGRIPAALDADFHADNTKVCYAAESQQFFFAEATIPILYTNQSFDREQNNEIRITIVAYDCQLTCNDPHKPSNGTITGVITIKDVNDNFPKFTERAYHATVIQGQVSPGSYLTKVYATDPDEEKEGLRYAISSSVRTPKQSYSITDSPISIDAGTGALSANEALREASYSFAVTVRDGVGHEDSAGVTIFVVAYSLQSELLFDAPFDLVSRNEKHIGRLLSNATQLTAVVDRASQKTNYTTVVAHFLDADGEFVDVNHALRRLMSSNNTARHELRSAYGLRDVEPVNTGGPKAFEAVIFGTATAVMMLLLLCFCLYCRQKHSYTRKLRHIAVQAAAHHATLSRQPTQKVNPYYATESVSAEAATAGRTVAKPPPPPPLPKAAPLQSTEL